MNPTVRSLTSDRRDEALDVTDRPVPAPLAALEAVAREIVPDPAERPAFGPVVGALADALRRDIYPC